MSIAQEKSPGTESTVQDYWALTKPRVMSLAIFTSGVGLLLAPGTIHPFIGCVALLCIAVGAGGSGALNMWYERSIDTLMKRTQSRPLPRCRVQPNEALSLGVILSCGAVFVLGLTVNYISAACLAFTIFFYVFVYTVILKPNTPHNIVIGGAAGAFPPVIGWVAVTGSFSIEPWLLFLIIFMWTPPHFWTLALRQSEDYARAKIPMLPVVQGAKETCKQILVYSAFLFLASLLPCVFEMLGCVYLFSALILSAIFMLYAYKVYHNAQRAMALFVYSILYLFALFLSMVVDYIVCQLDWMN